jgi:benzodiazapine receptor
MNGRRSALVLILFLAVCLGVSAVGAAVTVRSVATWYATLGKPAWSPPNWVFGPVWTLLYLMIAFAGWLVWRERGWSRGAVPLGLFAVQLALNAAWSPLFFGLRSPAAALVDIAALWIAIGATIVSFRRAVPLAALVLVPYWLWVSFATALNFAIWRLNP